jgi:hypothetical protein
VRGAPNPLARNHLVLDMAQEPKRPVLKQDQRVERFKPHPSDPPLVELQGFLGNSEKSGYWRIYLTPDLIEYVEIAEADIVEVRTSGEGSCILVKASAVLNLRAEFLCDAMPGGSFRGVERSAMLAGADLVRMCFMPWAIAARSWAMVLNMCDRGVSSMSDGRPRHFEVVGELNRGVLRAVRVR